MSAVCSCQIISIMGIVIKCPVIGCTQTPFAVSPCVAGVVAAPELKPAKEIQISW